MYYGYGRTFGIHLIGAAAESRVQVKKESSSAVHKAFRLNTSGGVKSKLASVRSLGK